MVAVTCRHYVNEQGPLELCVVYLHSLHQDTEELILRLEVNISLA